MEQQSAVALNDRPWPAVDLPEAYRILTAPGAPFETREEVIRGVSLRTYVNAMNDLRQVFDLARGWGDREFIIYEGERQTYGEHFRAAGKLGRVLHDSFGVRKGDRLVVAMRNLPEWSIAFWAGMSIGAVVTPLNAWGIGDELAYGISNSGAPVAIVDGERLERLAPYLGDLKLDGLISVRTTDDHGTGAIPLDDLIGPRDRYAELPDDPMPDPGLHTDDPATILYTSGTTGRPKGALGTHRNVLTNVISITFGAARATIRRGDPLPVPDPDAPQRVNLLPVPLFHVTGTNSMLIPTVIAGAKLILMHKWNPERFLELVETERVNGTTGVPAMVWQVLESPDFARRDLSSLDSYGYGGAAIAPELTLKFAELFPWFKPSQGYGATETSSVSIANSAEDYLRHPDSVGMPVPVCDVKVVDEDGNELPRGQAGELWIRGPNIVAGYWNNPDATSQCFTDGWYHTGDICRIDDEGFVYLLDRAKDMLIRGGENVYCVEIEDVLVAHPDVMDAAVVGLPHRILGEEVGALVQLRPGADVTEMELIAHASRHLAPFKVPVRIVVRTEEFPRNASGKTLKPILREELIATHASQPDGAVLAPQPITVGGQEIPLSAKAEAGQWAATTEESRSRGLRLGAAVAAVGLVAAGAYLARGAASQDEEIGYHPLDVPKPLAENLWIVDSGPISAMGLKLPIRMTVIRLADGGLWLHSPTRYTPALAKALTGLGPVRHLVAPTLAHWTFLAEWQGAFPDATVWAVPALRHRVQVQQSGVRIDNDLVEVGPPAWDAEVEQGLVRGGGGFEEAWFFHRPSRTLVLTDLIENLDPAKLRPATAAVMRATRATSGTTGLHLRSALRMRADAVRADVEKMIALAPETIVFAHGDIFRGRGTAQLAGAFAWLK
ncbi:AMP-binding protein [Sphingomonas sp. IC4-52]|uniref:AMP-binding protein n=1 Tax=Sphingomonas sp. IC4-52 TaxID=2887202 RepID=UPI001D120FD1|nr:AMP-binding protein [Sphingomonas sp. IC4-52]MCC2979799.1 AMP-binding protein [Sphingomonas sp. IC4-52]